MAASIATSVFFPATSPMPSPSKSPANHHDALEKLDFRGTTARPASSTTATQSARATTPIRAVPKVNGHTTEVEHEAGPTFSTGPSSSSSTSSSSSPAPRTFYNQLPDWSVLLAAITTIFLAAEKQWTLLDNWKPKSRPDMLADAFGFGRIMQDGLAFKQNFLIRSYEIGADRSASIETLMNHLQETALNHVRCAGLLGDGFGSTPEMSKRNLIWVVSKMNVLVDHYPSWGDIVEVETWVGASGKNGMRRDWHIQDYNTGQTILRATSLWVCMNKVTRKLAKIPEEVRAEIEPYFLERAAIIDEDSRKLPKLQGLNGNAENYLRKGLTPRWGDLDVNQHVNNVKYIGWILESAPMEILEKHELAGMTLEYRRECGRDSVVQSLTTVYTDCTDEPGSVHCEHLLSLESGANIVKARTAWRPKRSVGPAHAPNVLNLNGVSSVGV